MTLNSTDCVIKDNLNDESAFSQCVVLHNFTFQGKRILFFQNEMTLALGILISLGYFIYRSQCPDLSTWCHIMLLLQKAEGEVVGNIVLPTAAERVPAIGKREDQP